MGIENMRLRDEGYSESYCYECGGPIFRGAKHPVWLHADTQDEKGVGISPYILNGYDLDEDHTAVPDE